MNMLPSQHLHLVIAATAIMLVLLTFHPAPDPTALISAINCASAAPIGVGRCVLAVASATITMIMRMMDQQLITEAIIPP
jgi:hypothetical protein